MSKTIARLQQIWSVKMPIIATAAILAIAAHLLLWTRVLALEVAADFPLQVLLVIGGIPLVAELLRAAWRGEFGSDLLGGISIVTSVLLGEYLAGAIIVLMLSGGETLERFALRSASAVLSELARRMPSTAHRQTNGEPVTIPVSEIEVGDHLVIYPHEICPVDGEVLDGHGTMDESFLTGEPFQITKTAGSPVLSGAINGAAVIGIRVTRRAIDSRYAKIMQVMQESEQSRPQLRRLGDQLGAWYTPLAVGIALLAWLFSGDPVRFLAVLVIATPCPLLIAIPVSIIGSISLCARRAIIVKSPIALEQMTLCRTAIFDKTGTLTYGRPTLTEILPAAGFQPPEVLALVASLERYSKHPLASAILNAAEQAHLPLSPASRVSEPPGRGMQGKVNDHVVEVTGRRQLASQPELMSQIPAGTAGLECLVLIDGKYAATFRFRDAPRQESRRFLGHLGPQHQFSRLMIVSGDRLAEVEYLADKVGIDIVFAEQQPEQKLAIVRAETAQAKTLYVGDGINDAPAMQAATVGISIGKNSDIAAESAAVVVLDNTLEKVDEFLHISRRMRRIALQSAVGGMTLSICGMLLASFGWLSPVQGAIAQEVIDVLAVLNALRAAWPPRVLTDMPDAGDG